jgi:hypothetical protein
MVDSGAFSAWSKGVQVSLNPYIFWLLCNEGYIGHYFNRDVIAGENGRRERCRHKIEQAAAQSYFNFRRMKRARLNPIPVFHQNERFFWLRRYLDEGAQYIALAPFHATRPEGIAWLRDAFALVANYPNVKVHGLGVMSHFAVCKFPFYSVDAATWLRGGSRGQIPVPFFRDGHLDYERRPKTLNVNDLAQADGLLHARFEQFAALVGVSEAEVLETLAADERYPASRDLRQRARRVRQDAQAAAASLDADPRWREPLERMKASEAILASREQAWREAQNAEAEQHKRRAQQAVQRMADLQKLEAPTLKALERAVADALTLETELGHEPVDPERLDLRRQLAAQRELLQPKAAELREADDWQRWANAGVQEQLIEKMTALGTEADANIAFRKMRELQEQWKAVASAPRDKAEQLWTRFRAAAQAVRERVEPLRAAQHTQQVEHLARKVALCEQAEALANSTDWIATADALKALQAEWKTIGPAPRRDEQSVWDRFRTACNRFFTRRQEDLKQRKQVWTTNLEAKEALIARAEALSAVTDFTAGFAELKALQAAWKASGPVKKAKSEQVWQKFRAACDAFMERYRTRDTQQFADRLARREAVAVDLETLATGLADGSVTHQGLLERVRSIRTGWQQAGSVPREVLHTLANRFDAALGVVLTAAPEAFRHSELDAEGNRAQLEQLCERVEQVASRQPAMAGASSVAQLADQLRERLAANTIGGRVDDESKWKSHEYDVRAAQDAWQRVGYVPESVAAPLAARFQRAVHRFYGEKKPGAPAPGPGPRGRK